MVDVLRLVSYLQARTAHAEMHTIHVNLTREWLTLGSYFHICVFVLEDRHLDLDFLLATLVDRLSEAKESWVRAACLLWDEALMCVFVRLLNTTLI